MTERVKKLLGRSYLLRLPSQSAVIVTLFALAGVQQHPLAWGMLGVLLCVFLRAAPP